MSAIFPRAVPVGSNKKIAMESIWASSGAEGNCFLLPPPAGPVRLMNGMQRLSAGGEMVQKRISFRQYRAIDLSLFAAMMAGAEMLIVLAATRWFPGQPYTLSAVPAVTAIVMMRWGPFAALHAALGGAVFCLTSGGGWQQLLIYGVGNLLGLAGLGLFKAWGKDGVRQDALRTMLFGLLVTLLMQLGRAAVSLLFGAKMADLLRFFTTDVITLLFSAVVVWIARRQDGVFEDQKNYLLRVSQEEEEEKENWNEG